MTFCREYTQKSCLASSVKSGISYVCTFRIWFLPYFEGRRNRLPLPPHHPRSYGCWTLFVFSAGHQLPALVSVLPSVNVCTTAAASWAVFHHCQVSPHHCAHGQFKEYWLDTDFVLAPGTITGYGSNMSKACVELLAHKKMFLSSIYPGCSHCRCISINGYTPSSSQQI